MKAWRDQSLINFVAMAAALAAVISVPQCLHAEILPAGTEMEVRMSVSTGSRISQPGEPVEAVVIAPVFAGGQLVVPQGAIASGTIESVQRLGLGLKHSTARIAYRFDRVRMQDGGTLSIDARVADVETAKERVSAEGVIGGIRPGANLSSTVGFYTLPFLCVDPDFGIPVLAVKFLIARSPDPEIYFPAGTEMILQVQNQVHIPATIAEPAAMPRLPAPELARASWMLEQLPEQRADNGKNRPSDLVNIILLGSGDAIDRAFRAAGWSGAQRSSILAIFGMYHCMVQRMGYRTAPMGRLTLNGARADAEYQKSLDTFSKRHHLRLWRQAEGNVWFGTATEDVGYKLHRMHLTHATDPFIDNERNKIVNDLAFTGCVDTAALMNRTRNIAGVNQGRSPRTDGQVAVLRLNACENARAMPSESPDSKREPRRVVQALIALRNDLVRSNPVSLVSNTVRLIEDREHAGRGSKAGSRPGEAPERSAESKWIRPTVVGQESAASAAARDSEEGSSFTMQGDVSSRNWVRRVRRD